MTIGSKIRILRRGRNMTQKELAEASGLAEITIRQYEADKFKPKIEQIEKLAAALNVSKEEINTKDYWLNENGGITVNAPDIDSVLNFDAKQYQKEQDKKRNDAIKLLRKKGFESDLAVTLVDVFSKLNQEGRAKAVKTLCELAELPEYKITNNE